MKDEISVIVNKFTNNYSKNLSFISIFKIYNLFLKVRKNNNLEYMKVFIKEYYYLEEEMADEFYELILNKMHSGDSLSLFRILIKKNIYLLISYLKYDMEDINGLDEVITPKQYYMVSKRYVNKMVEMLKNISEKESNSYLDDLLKDEGIWLLKRTPVCNELEYKLIAYKIIFSIGFINGVELLAKKYGEIDYEKIYFLFSKLNIKNNYNENLNDIFSGFLFANKRDYNNIIRQMLRGEFIELFLNFDYFYNNISYFVNKLGIKMSKGKIKNLLGERYLARNVEFPEITGDVLDDMLSSYYHKYDDLNVKEYDIYNKNLEIYDKFLRNKYKSSLPMIAPIIKEDFICEVISLSDPRNLVLGYRAGNCFRINGDASLLFRNFLKSEHMRLVSISSKEYKDFAMMLVMRNGNVLIGQGIEVSKRAPKEIQGKKLYDICRKVLKKMMEYMNANEDEIVATIIGSTNSNVSEYNNQILPFLINPILENNNNFYNGIYNYQCLLDISQGKSLNDIKLYIPSIRYYDKREQVLRRTKGKYTSDNTYMEIEKRLIYFRGIRFFKMNDMERLSLYENLLSHNEVYTYCNKDWYITLFDDGEIDRFILDNVDERAKDEYDVELSKIQDYISKRKKLYKRKSS